MLDDTAFDIHLRIKCSITLLTMGVKDTGLKSDSIGGDFLGSGITQVVFHRLHTCPSITELLKMAHSGAANRGEKSLRTHAGMSSGPVALVAFR